MPLTIQPMTELDAVNVSLMSIGQAPVNTLDASGIRDVNIAQLVLHNTMRAFLSEGWDFNTDYGYTLTPNGSDRIQLTDAMLSVDPTNTYIDYVERYDTSNDYRALWDLVNQTFDITDTVKCDIIWFYEFEQIPQAARDYIAVKATRQFQAGAVGSEILFRFSSIYEDELRANFMRTQTRRKDRNMMYQSVDPITRAIFTRRHNPR